MSLFRNPWTVVIILLFLVGCAILLAGQHFDIPLLMPVGFFVMGLTSVVVGLEGVVKRRILLPSRWHSMRQETWVGPAAVAQGLLFIVMGFLLAGLAIVAYGDSGRDLFLDLVAHPGPALLFFSCLCLVASISVASRSQEQKGGPRWAAVLDFVAGRMLGALILIALGIGAAYLGVTEILTPERFDAMGGGFLEVLFGAAKP